MNLDDAPRGTEGSRVDEGGEHRESPEPTRGAASLHGLRVPRATYRLQLHAGFRFGDAMAIIPYLADLGISHVYCSPYLRARAGSTHGYDVVDHGTINPEIGTRDELDAFVAALHAHGMGQVIDLVPNHMGIMGADNAWWLDVLENGQASEYADYFDIDWRPADPDLADRVLVPVLGDHYGMVLSRGELNLHFDPGQGAFDVRYFDHRFPVDPRHYARFLEAALTVEPDGDVDDGALDALATLAYGFGQLAPRNDALPGAIAARRGKQIELKGELARIAAANPGVAAAIQRVAGTYNGKAGDAASFDALHELLEAQAYRLAYWRVASDEINYRRFFDINELAALRMESEPVFEATHKLVFELVAAGMVDAVRIDHPDGLYDPAAYFRRLQDRFRSLVPPPPSGEEPLYVSVEKIIAPFEAMPESWAVSGTTGYRFANVVNGLFVDCTAETRFDRIYGSFTGERARFPEVALRAKHLILRDALASELTVLTNRLVRIARADRATRDYTLNTLRRALSEVIVAFPVYRTYIADDVSAEDRRYIEWAVGRARKTSRNVDTGIFDFIKSVLLGSAATDPVGASRMNAFARKFQQLTAPVMAKGVEDTSFYLYNRLVSLNDVGGDPATFGYTVNAFHGASQDRAAKWPRTMLATSTHDNKRSEDVRMRIDVLTEMPDFWRAELRRWSRLNQARKTDVDGEPAPSRNDEYLIYQTLLGSFPDAGIGQPDLAGYRERIRQYMLKAVREAKAHTSWINGNDEYESATARFIEALLEPTGRNLFLRDLQATASKLAWFGMMNSLSMVVLKLTSPGVPDIYQGNELWDFSLADPDNRRPVDYALRRELLASLRDADVEAIFADPADGRAKLHVTQRLLALRREQPGLFLHGGYLPAQARGERAGNVVAFARRHEGRGIVVIAGRMFASLGIDPGTLPCGTATWGGTQVETPFIEAGTVLRNALTNRTCEVREGGIAVGEAFDVAPGAVLVFESGTTENRA